MGEYADMIVDDMIDSWDGSAGPRRPRQRAWIKTCAYCGETDLRWGNVPGGNWRLHTTTGELHVCPQNQPWWPFRPVTNVI